MRFFSAIILGCFLWQGFFYVGENVRVNRDKDGKETVVEVTIDRTGNEIYTPIEPKCKASEGNPCPKYTERNWSCRDGSCAGRKYPAAEIIEK